MRKGKVGAAMMLSLMMGVSLLSGCSTGGSSGNSETTTEAAASSNSSSEDNEKNAVYGVISSVSSDSITIDVGTLEQQNRDENKNSSTGNASENTGSDSTESNASQEKNDTKKSDTKKSDTNSIESTERSSSEKPAEKSMITTTGETKTISLTSSTKVSRQRPSNPPQGGGQSAENGQQPEKPEDSSNGNSSDNLQEKELSVSNLKEKDEVAIILDSDGNASEIRLLSGGGPGRENGSAPQGGGQSAAPTSYISVTEYSKDETTTGRKYFSNML